MAAKRRVNFKLALVVYPADGDDTVDALHVNKELRGITREHADELLAHLQEFLGRAGTLARKHIA